MQPKSEDGTRPTVLVVDDEAPMRAIERRVLEELGYIRARGGRWNETWSICWREARASTC